MKRRKHHIPTIVWMIIIFLLSSIPGVYLGKNEIRNVLGHYAEYFILAFLIHRVEKNNKITFLTAFVYSIFDEIHQLFIPNRFCDIFDIFIDTLGIISSIFIYNLIQKSYKHKKFQKKV